MPEKKVKPAAKKARVVLSPNLKLIEKLKKTVLTEQTKLRSRCEKLLALAEKNIARISAQLDKARKSKTLNKPIRGRKPAKNALQLLQLELQKAKDEKEQIALEYKRLSGEQKALASFDKEWKKLMAKKAAAAKKKAVAAKKKAAEKKKVVKKSAKKVKPAAKAVKAAKSTKAKPAKAKSAAKRKAPEKVTDDSFNVVSNEEPAVNPNLETA